MKKILFTLVIGLIVGAFIFGLYRVGKKYIFDIEEPYYATVVDARCSEVVLDTDKHVSLAGILIPWSNNKLNYSLERAEYPAKLLNGKRVKVELVERARSGAYHKYDLVRVYLQDGTCVNTYLLENGMAFYSHGYYRGKEQEEAAEARAKKAGKGIWANKDKLDLLYVGSKHWEGIHYPECPELKKVRPEDRIEYYTRPMAVHWYRGWYPDGCPYCAEIRKTKPKRLQ